LGCSRFFYEVVVEGKEKTREEDEEKAISGFRDFFFLEIWGFIVLKEGLLLLLNFICFVEFH
jgi:hypothetical protein